MRNLIDILLNTLAIVVMVDALLWADEEDLCLGGTGF